MFLDYTGSRIDYSNPDAGTIIAEATDEELGKLSNSKSPRGGGGRGRGRKRKASESDGIEDGDSGSDYGKKKKRNVTLLKSSPSKPSSSKGRRGRPPGKKTGRRNVKSKKYDSDSDNDNEVQYDDASSGMEQGS
jgi:hypothetical protein